MKTWEHRELDDGLSEKMLNVTDWYGLAWIRYQAFDEWTRMFFRLACIG